MNKENETRVSTESNELNISDNSNINLDNCCNYCNKLFTKELWCEEYDPFRMIEGWTSGNNDIDRFIKDTIYGVKNDERFLEWITQISLIHITYL
ncbi:uncharacterized protein OCT59_015629 [Rhizophagus irregularis]|uniref:uncharacterized protein n=1 Tax=Rhizophagus irregularis TaxID=588596 RepID=UPI000CBCC6FB|nr:hypothetical protein OCT59_015629 [Rhizophagus irregularis]GBC15417.1 kinase-like domain-containing protein [Rhizophagus irregularis DAOM 181602=DAOM 197198]